MNYVKPGREAERNRGEAEQRPRKSNLRRMHPVPGLEVVGVKNLEAVLDALF